MNSEDKPKRLPILVNLEKCVGCLSCVLRCSFRRVKAFSPTKSDIEVRRAAGGEPELKISFTENCDDCGICARFCLYGALTKQK